MASLFEQLDKGRSPPIDEASKQARKLLPAQKLLDWLQHWNKPTIRARDICIYGPRPRDRERAINSAAILVEHGWLTPVQPCRHDSYEWQIIRKPIIHPTVANVAD